MSPAKEEDLENTLGLIFLFHLLFPRLIFKLKIFILVTVLVNEGHYKTSDSKSLV
jgi:hypothetical protein